MAIDVEELWDYSKPEESEMRFRQAISGASANDILILQTQIARSFGLRTKFDKARSILASIESDVECATAEVSSKPREVTMLLPFKRPRGQGWTILLLMPCI